MEIRLATEADLPAIVEIYNLAIPGHQATADTELITVESRRGWLAAHDPSSHPLWVAVADEQVLGWTGFQPFYGRPAYLPTAEISTYVHPDVQAQGVGRKLVAHALQAAPGLGIQTILAFVFGHNEPSLRICEAFGFVRWANLPRIAHMPDGRRDVVILGLELDPVEHSMPSPPARS